jgi:hypothetical protein
MCEVWIGLAFLFTSINVARLVAKKKVKGDVTIFEAGTGDFPNP